MAKIYSEIRLPIKIYSDLISKIKGVADAESDCLARIGMRSLEKFKAFDKADSRRKPTLSKKTMIIAVEEDDPISAACTRAEELKSKEISVQKSAYHAAAQPVEDKTLEELVELVLFDYMSPAGACSVDFFV